MNSNSAGLLPESLIWRYVVQLTSALRCIHAAGLACRVMDPTKILVTDQSRIRINGVGVFDVLGYDSSHANPRAHMPKYQQDDLMALGKVVNKSYKQIKKILFPAVRSYLHYLATR